MFCKKHTLLLQVYNLINQQFRKSRLVVIYSPKNIVQYSTSGSHGDVHVHGVVLGCDSMWVAKFWWNILPPSSGLVPHTGLFPIGPDHPQLYFSSLHFGWPVSLAWSFSYPYINRSLSNIPPFDFQDTGRMSLWNVGTHLQNHMAS
jgi:hypothetical protein